MSAKLMNNITPAAKALVEEMKKLEGFLKEIIITASQAKREEKMQKKNVCKEVAFNSKNKDHFTANNCPKTREGGEVE